MLACVCKPKKGKCQRVLAHNGYYIIKMCEQYNNASIIFPNVSKFHNVEILQLN